MESHELSISLANGKPVSVFFDLEESILFRDPLDDPYFSCALDNFVFHVLHPLNQGSDVFLPFSWRTRICPERSLFYASFPALSLWAVKNFINLNGLGVPLLSSSPQLGWMSKKRP